MSSLLAFTDNNCPSRVRVPLRLCVGVHHAIPELKPHESVLRGAGEIPVVLHSVAGLVDALKRSREALPYCLITFDGKLARSGEDGRHSGNRKGALVGVVAKSRVPYRESTAI